MVSTSQTTFGRYELLEILGRGGFATVFRARDPLLRRDVALKTLLPHLADDTSIRHRFQSEAQRIARLRHPNIVTVHDVGEVNGCPFFTMELIEGQTLATVIAAGPFADVARAIGILRDLCAAIDCLHEARLVHRDIKPANVMLDASGRVVLMDFGIARSLDEASSTQTGISIGTPKAMAPEQVQGREVGPSADIYALGVLAYQLLAGRPPFEGDLAHILYAHAHEQPPDLHELRPGLPEHVYDAIAATLVKDPDARPAFGSAFAAALAGEAPLAVGGPLANTGGATTAGGASVPATQADARSAGQPAVGSASGRLADQTVTAMTLTPVTPEERESQRRASPLIAGAVVATLIVAGIAAGGVVLAVRGGGHSTGGSPAAVAPAAAATAAPPAPTAAPETAAHVSLPAATQAASPPAAPHASAILVAEASSVAGSAERGFADGPAAEAKLDTPSGLAIDSSGTIYVADSHNNRIRKIALDGTVTTIAGSGDTGSVDGVGSAASFNGPTGVAVDGAGSVYVADYYGNRVRKIAPDGRVTTLAGSGVDGFADGSGDVARFSGPADVAVDADGDVLVADFNNNRIRRVTADGSVTTVAGTAKGFRDGSMAVAQLAEPGAIAVDHTGRIYVADSANNRIRRIGLDGLVASLAGSAANGLVDGPGATAQFSNPGGIAVDVAGSVYVADSINNCIRRIAPDGSVTTVAGTAEAGFSDGSGVEARFSQPLGMAIDADGNLYIADSQNNRIRKLSLKQLP